MNSKLILIGGKSGSGKTTLINKLIEMYPDVYLRPISYTTRKQRPEETNNEYIFISSEQFFDLSEKGEILNIDKVYGHYYGMRRDFILDNLKDGILLIKEIHPQNHKKINQLLKDNVISILLKSQPIKSTRNDEDAEYYNSICEDDFDIIFYNDHGA